ncbi:hypothetical protein [uncultured Thiodictyon sp.]|uniref:hypothetical protein n=1 Tax=uncultured Thiodictyon sp. TaxID=1846217 RepID=UPI0025FCF48E|nr:hypothetical protein [uncultured Thiodictyon sp.]
MPVTSPQATLSDLEQQAIIRAKLVGRIYYSHAEEAISRFNRKIDDLALAATALSTGCEHRQDTFLVMLLAHFLTYLPVGCCNVSEPEIRYNFFVDLLFEKYNPSVLEHCTRAYQLPPNFEALDSIGKWITLARSCV